LTERRELHRTEPHGQVDPIVERTGEARAVARDVGGRAPTAAGRIPVSQILLDSLFFSQLKF
jgi:hypothetical protein